MHLFHICTALSGFAFCSQAYVFTAWTNDGYKEGYDVSMSPELKNLDEINPYWYNLGIDDSAIAISNEYHGIDLNFEGTHSKTRGGSQQQEDNFFSFLCELKDSLNSINKVLHLTIQCETEILNNYYIYSDYKRSAACSDRIKVMTYDYQITISDGNYPQPTQPLSWTMDVLTYTHNAGVPYKKLQVGVLNAYYCFTKQGDKKWTGYNPFKANRYRALTHKEYSKMTVGLNVQNIWLDDVCMLETYSYWTYRDSEYICNVPSKDTMDARLALVTELGLAGVAMWHLGQEDLSIYENFGNNLVLPNLAKERDARACRNYYEEVHWGTPMHKFGKVNAYPNLPMLEGSPAITFYPTSTNNPTHAKSSSTLDVTTLSPTQTPPDFTYKCQPPYTGYPECAGYMDYVLLKWDTQEFAHANLDGSRCGAQAFISATELYNGKPLCPMPSLHPPHELESSYTTIPTLSTTTATVTEFAPIETS
eukprot:Awhi_evm1s1835